MLIFIGYSSYLSFIVRAIIAISRILVNKRQQGYHSTNHNFKAACYLPNYAIA